MIQINHPAQAIAPAYRVTSVTQDPDADTGRPELYSLGRLRAVFQGTVCDPNFPGSGLLNPTNGVIVFIGGWLAASAYMAVPALDFPAVPVCAHCGQWEFEHQIPNPSCCHRFSTDLVPAEAVKWFCPRCGLNIAVHALPYTRACGLEYSDVA